MEDYSIMALAIILGLNQILSMLKNRGIDLSKMSKQLDDLHDWHDHDDPNEVGVKIWWNRKYIYDLIKALKESQETQTNLIAEMHREVKSIRQAVTLKE